MSRDGKQLEALTSTRKREILHSAIELVARRIKKEEISSSLGDLIRLLELDADLVKHSEDREIIGTWVDNRQETGNR